MGMNKAGVDIQILNSRFLSSEGLYLSIYLYLYVYGYYQRGTDRRSKSISSNTILSKYRSREEDISLALIHDRLTFSEFSAP